MPQLPDPTTIPAPFDPALPPSPSLLLYLFAERVAPAARWGVKAPLTGSRVNADRLANALFAVAFWQLRATGLIQMEIAEERHMLKTTTHLRVALTAPTPTAQDGIAGGILDILTPGSRGKLTPAWDATPQWLKHWSGQVETFFTNKYANAGFTNLPAPTPNPPPATVTDAVKQWYGRDVANPERLPITWTEREGIAKGYLMAEDAHRNPLVALLLGKTTTVPQRETIAALEPTFAQLHAAWQAFQANEAALADRLTREIAAGIKARLLVVESSSG